jgi:hypothetical protein
MVRAWVGEDGLESVEVACGGERLASGWRVVWFEAPLARDCRGAMAPAPPASTRAALAQWAQLAQPYQRPPRQNLRKREGEFWQLPHHSRRRKTLTVPAHHQPPICCTLWASAWPMKRTSRSRAWKSSRRQSAYTSRPTRQCCWSRRMCLCVRSIYCLHAPPAGLAGANCHGSRKLSMAAKSS